MITEISKPADIDREFWEDYDRATYWIRKKVNPQSERMKVFEGAFDVLDGIKQRALSDVYYYDSPKTGNKWMMWVCAKYEDDGEMHFHSRIILYRYTEVSMTIMVPITIDMEGRSDGIVECSIKGVNVYTHHMFMRMADKDRLGIDLSDRLKVIRNFVEYVMAGWSDTQPPRNGEKHWRIMFRAPGSWINGHIVMVGDRHVSIYKTFWPDKSMTPGQLHYVHSFRKFADAKMSKGKK